MSKIPRTIPCKVGIFDTVYRLVLKRDGTAIVVVPDIRWKGSSGNLSFAKVRVRDPKRVAWVKDYFMSGCLVDKDGRTIDEMLYDLW